VIAGLDDAIKPLRKACGWSDETRSAATSPSTEATAASVGTAYVVHVGSKRSQAEALASYSEMQRKYPDLLGKYRPLIQKADFGPKGIWYRLGIGPISEKSTAKDLCFQLKSSGLPDCLVTMR
jgi:cell division septation protein DedD